MVGLVGGGGGGPQGPDRNVPSEGETQPNKRNFGAEIRAAEGDRSEQQKLLRELVMEAARVDEPAAHRVFESLDEAELTIVTREGWDRAVEAAKSLRRISALADELFPTIAGDA